MQFFFPIKELQSIVSIDKGNPKNTQLPSLKNTGAFVPCIKYYNPTKILDIPMGINYVFITENQLT